MILKVPSDQRGGKRPLMVALGLLAEVGDVPSANTRCMQPSKARWFPSGTANVWTNKMPAKYLETKIIIDFPPDK